MKKLPSVIAVVALLTLGLIGTLAAQSGPQPAAPGTNVVGTKFNYQGQLRRSNADLTDQCQMAFGLFDAPFNGVRQGAPLTLTVSLTRSLFTVNLDFGVNVFNGTERWLDIGVKCTGDSAFTALGGRQQIMPVPYALALPGLYTQPNPTSPNVIGGYAGNTIADTVVGGVIGGGGLAGHPNRVTDNYSTVGGGYENWALDAFATIGGGASNQASGHKSTVPGGQSAHATHEGEFAYANGAFAEIGDAQTSMYVLKATTGGAVTTTLMTNGSEIGVRLAPKRTMVFDILVVASNSPVLFPEGNARAAGFRIQGVIQREGGGFTYFADAPIITSLGTNSSSSNVAAIANDFPGPFGIDRLDLRVTDSSAVRSTEPLRWVAVVRTVEVSFP